MTRVLKTRSIFVTIQALAGSAMVHRTYLCLDRQTGYSVSAMTACLVTIVVQSRTVVWLLITTILFMMFFAALSRLNAFEH